MIEFNNKGFAIKIESTTPVADWLTLVDEMLDLLQSEREDMPQNRYYVIGFIRDMLPKEQHEIHEMSDFINRTEALKRAAAGLPPINQE